MTHFLNENTPQNKAHWEKFFAGCDDPPPPEALWEKIFAGFAVICIGLMILVGGMFLYDFLAPVIADLGATVGQRATAVWQWVVTFGHCPVCCGHGI